MFCVLFCSSNSSSAINFSEVADATNLQDIRMLIGKFRDYLSAIYTCNDSTLLTKEKLSEVVLC